MPPPRHFTHYWSNDTWQAYRATATDGELLDHIAGNVFTERGVSPGDMVYVVTVLRGALHLLGKLQVAFVADAETAAAALGTTPDHLWEADDHVVADAATPMDFDRQVPLSVAEQLRFVSGDDEPKPMKFKGGMIDQQTMRGVRRLTPQSALLLDGLLGPPLPLHLAERLAAFAALPEEAPDSGQYVEGAVTQITVNAYERNPKARAACIAHWGLACGACGMTFEGRYGPQAAGYIHVHHLRPLAAIGAEYVLDPVNDLMPVCPNCHAVMHMRREEPYTVADVREMLQLHKGR